MAANSSLGPMIRMRALPINQIPSHPSLSSHQHSTAPNISTFTADAINEAQKFMTAYLPSKFDVKSSDKRSEPATAPIQLLSHIIKSADLPREIGDATEEQNGPAGAAENWFARISLHENQAAAGTGSWEEMDASLRQNHSQHEKDYTPDVLEAHEVLNWREELQSVGARVEGGWEDVDVGVMEMLHHIPTPLNNRVFTVLVITAKREKEFITIQMPVEAKHLPGTKFATDGKVTPGIYVSVERGELVEEGTKTRWEMATASDAGGNLPMFAQKMGVPGAVVKDVGLVMKWLDERRQRKTG